MKFLAATVLAASIATVHAQQIVIPSYDEDLDEDLILADQASNAMQNLALAIQSTQGAYLTADNIISQIINIRNQDPTLAVTGFITGMSKLFVQSFEYHKILVQLQAISAQIDALQQDMEYYFNKVLDAIQQDTCYAEYAQYELTITQAAKKLNAYLANQDSDLADVYLQAFMDECDNAKCDDATAALAASITGNSGLFGCDMMAILYQGDVNGGYYVGWRDQVASKAAYLLSLVNTGVTVQSAYLTIETQNESAYRVVDSQYGDILLAAGDRIIEFDKKCQDEWWNNSLVNQGRMVQVFADAHLSNADMALQLYNTLDQVNPYRLWQASSYDKGVHYGSNQYNRCYHCSLYQNYADSYNILISSLPKDSVANLLVVQDSRIVDASNSKHDCDRLINDLFDELCLYGAHCVVREVDLNLETDYDSRFAFDVGNHKTITAWAVNDWCYKPDKQIII